VYMKRKALLTAAATFALLWAATLHAQELAPAAPPATAAAPQAQAAPPAAAAVAPATVATTQTWPTAPAPAVAPAIAAEPQAQSATPATPPSPAEAPEPFGLAQTLFDDGNYLGVRVEDLTRENMSAYGLSGEPRGVGVSQVLKGSPAERAGLRERDVIVRFDGEPVTSVRKLNRLIGESAAGHAARLAVLRGGSEQEVSATLARRARVAPAGGVLGALGVPGEDWERNAEEWQLKGGELGRRLEELQRDGSGVFALGASRRIGVTTTALGKQLADYFGVQHGVLVNSVEAGSPADKAGLKAGDVLTELDGKSLDDATDLVRALGAKQEGEVTLTFVRDKKQRTVRVTPEKRQGPQGLFITPGAVRVAPPVASIAAPGVTLIPTTPLAPNVMRAPRLLRDPDFITPPIVISPRVLSAPRALSAPRVVAAPSLRVTPRVLVVGPGGRVL
jgi:membrane-associated protease RseP (regulator of RpoE activity)